MLKIITATKDQLIEVQKIAHITWPKTFSDNLTPSQIDYMLALMYDLDALKAQVTDKNHVFLLAKEDGKYLGFCSYELNSANTGKVKIHKLYLLPDVQRKGIGRQLIAEVGLIAQKHAYQFIYLNVNRLNLNAIQAYLAIGFYESKREVIAIGNGFIMDDIVMEMKL
jgi:GNAT superfamily N-acetyltransferase